MKRKIIHVDIDAFFASVEELDNPQLKTHPIAIGNNDNSGIVTTANYIARKYGIHSAMPVFMAKKLCPDLIMVPSNMNKYKIKSKEVFEILSTFTENIEQVSIDECYLDMTFSDDSPLKIAKTISYTIKKQTGLTVSIGISYNKFLAKIASDWNKPNGIKIISEKDIPEILYDLDIKNVHGIGKKTEKKLKNIGITTVYDMMQLSKEFCYDNFGKSGIDIYNRIRGIDERKVTPYRERKSLGVERTFKETNNPEKINEYISKFSKELSNDLIKRNIRGRTITVKIKNSDFKVTTRSKTFEYALYKEEDIEKIANELFKEIYQNEKLRLIGISASNLVNNDFIQITLF